jgi:hypothetical protein
MKFPPLCAALGFCQAYISENMPEHISTVQRAVQSCELPSGLEWYETQLEVAKVGSMLNVVMDRFVSLGPTPDLKVSRDVKRGFFDAVGKSMSSLYKVKGKLQGEGGPTQPMGGELDRDLMLAAYDDLLTDTRWIDTCKLHMLRLRQAATTAREQTEEVTLGADEEGGQWWKSELHAESSFEDVSKVAAIMLGPLMGATLKVKLEEFNRVP